ncbi:hypothetical protein PTSG_10582 [Salpingoeca rosetta]|uniref:Uncharacterized protein n=1 Tax=Salpingoeca rosetta (strain ATCC 50818 / BSB-021) TaxID=946362 RepID=F2URS2_SALR5|nr:uncharacterized protein PTSG_10582 [Salpingoeca rosetta]EGD80327.1 hypothetical protein PTSG_10582 [Salpingoeca rosetta]|eukprot:XP_004988117.1 hypothetical protein PTSG_10582 [Salpingoeca rosetta]
MKRELKRCAAHRSTPQHTAAHRSDGEDEDKGRRTSSSMKRRVASLPSGDRQRSRKEHAAHHEDDDSDDNEDTSRHLSITITITITALDSCSSATVVTLIVDTVNTARCNFGSTLRADAKADAACFLSARLYDDVGWQGAPRISTAAGVDCTTSTSAAPRTAR